MRREWDSNPQCIPAVITVATNGEGVVCYPMTEFTHVSRHDSGGGSGIRTHGATKDTTVFETVRLGHSRIPPALG